LDGGSRGPWETKGGGGSKGGRGGKKGGSHRNREGTVKCDQKTPAESALLGEEKKVPTGRGRAGTISPPWEVGGGKGEGSLPKGGKKQFAAKKGL